MSEASGEDDLEDDQDYDQEQPKALHVVQEVQELASGQNSDDEGAVQEEEDEVEDTRPRSKWFYPDIIGNVDKMPCYTELHFLVDVALGANFFTTSWLRFVFSQRHHRHQIDRHGH